MQGKFLTVTPLLGPHLIPLKALKWLMEKHAPLKIKPSLDPDLFKWSTKMLSQCNLDRYRINKSRMLKISLHSRECLEKLNKKYQINYQGRSKGTLQIFRSEKQLKAVEKDTLLLDESGTRYQLLNSAECLKQEPWSHSHAGKTGWRIISS